MTTSPISNVSDTALWVAAFRAQESERTDALFHDPLASELSGEKGRAIAAAMPYPKILAWMMAVRTVAIDRLIFEAIEAGVDTVINIGAGLDTRPYRLNLPADLVWIEIDFPHMVAAKNSQLAHATPHCRLQRQSLDVTDRQAAQRLYAALGAQSKKALIITEGVVAYLDNATAANLASDLREIPSFAYWIQDYRRTSPTMRHPNKLKQKLKNAPFLFNHPDPLAFFADHGWQVHHDIKAITEGERLGRPFPVTFPWNLLMRFMPAARAEELRNGMGYALFAAK